MEITKYFNNKLKFNGVFPRNNLFRIKDGVYVINLDDKKVKDHIEVHYLLTETHVHTLNILGLNIFLKMY